MFTAFIYTYVEATFVQIKILYHSLNRQLNQQPAIGKKRAAKSYFCEFCALISFLQMK